MTPNSGAVRCALLLGLWLCVAPLTGRATSEIPMSFEDRVKGATTIFAGTVSRIDSTTVEPLRVSPRYYFVNVTFVKDGADGLGVEAMVRAKCQDVLILDRTGRRSRCESWFPHPSFAIGSRYAGVRVTAGTPTPERRFLDDIRLILNPPAPEPVPAHH